MIENYILGKKRSLRMYIYTYNKSKNHYGTHPKSCTGSYKIAPNQQKVRELIKKKFNLTKTTDINEIEQEIYIGYSTDEIHRIKRMLKYDNKGKKITYRFPLNELKMSFVDTINYLKANNKTIKRSACFMCPFRNDLISGMGWIDIFKDDYLNFVRALNYDVSIRNCKNSINHFKEYNIYLDSSCIPLWKIYENIIEDKNLVNTLNNKDKKGNEDMKIKNRKWKQPSFQKCTQSIIGGCSL